MIDDESIMSSCARLVGFCVCVCVCFFFELGPHDVQPSTRAHYGFSFDHRGGSGYESFKFLVKPPKSSISWPTSISTPFLHNTHRRSSHTPSPVSYPITFTSPQHPLPKAHIHRDHHLDLPLLVPLPLSSTSTSAPARSPHNSQQFLPHLPPSHLHTLHLRTHVNVIYYLLIQPASLTPHRSSSPTFLHFTLTATSHSPQSANRVHVLQRGPKPTRRRLGMSLL
jgi:hypothetical protein